MRSFTIFVAATLVVCFSGATSKVNVEPFVQKADLSILKDVDFSSIPKRAPLSNVAACRTENVEEEKRKWNKKMYVPWLVFLRDEQVFEVPFKNITKFFGCMENHDICDDLDMKELINGFRELNKKKRCKICPKLFKKIIACRMKTFRKKIVYCSERREKCPSFKDVFENNNSKILEYFKEKLRKNLGKDLLTTMDVQ